MKNTVKQYSHFKFIMNLATNSQKKIVLKSCVIYKISMEEFCTKFKRHNPVKPIYGIMVTKKLGGAVERNFIKRRIRSALNGVDFSPNCVIIVARKQCETMNFEKIKTEIMMGVCQK